MATTTSTRPGPSTQPIPDDLDPRPTVVRARGVTLDHGSGRGVTDLDLDVPEGCIFGLVGPSGAGKTTAVRLVLGLLEPDAGEVTVLGAPARRADRQRLGYLPQLPVLWPDLTIRHNLNLVASLYGMPWRARFWPKGRRGKAARARIGEVLRLVDLEDVADTRLGAASGGEQRRLGLAAALVHRPDLLVLDEPTTGIDPVIRRALWARFRELRDEGRTLFVTTQYVTEAEHCDLVGLVVDGRVLHVDSPGSLRRLAFDGELVDVRLTSRVTHAVTAGLLALDGVRGVVGRDDGTHVRLRCDDADRRTAEIVTWCRDAGHEVVSISPHLPSFDDVFVRLVDRADHVALDERVDADTVTGDLAVPDPPREERRTTAPGGRP